MNIFESIQHYAGKWGVASSRNFSVEEVNAIKEAKVVDSQYGVSVCFYLKSGDQAYIPVSNDCEATVGQTVDVANAKILTLHRDGSEDIQRVQF